jgi:hypothetical protein
LQISFEARLQAEDDTLKPLLSSVIGSIRTNQAGLAMSVVRGEPEATLRVPQHRQRKADSSFHICVSGGRRIASGLMQFGDRADGKRPSGSGSQPMQWRRLNCVWNRTDKLG